MLNAFIAFVPLFITIEGTGHGWGQESFDVAKENAYYLAREACQGEVEMVSEWELTVMNRKEGYFHASAKADFNCLKEII